MILALHVADLTFDVYLLIVFNLFNPLLCSGINSSPVNIIRINPLSVDYIM